MILSDHLIKKAVSNGGIVITPFNPDNIGPNSYDVHLSPRILVYNHGILDAKADNGVSRLEIVENGMLLRPGELYLGTTLEYTETNAFVPFLEGKSSIGRLGIKIHATAGKGDYGFKGHWTLEIECTRAIRIYAGMPIGQLLFFTTEPPTTPYDRRDKSNYNGSNTIDPVPSKLWKWFERNHIDTGRFPPVTHPSPLKFPSQVDTSAPPPVKND